MIGWGCFTIAHGFVKNEAQLIAYRLMIGVFEAGYYPNCVYYFGMMYVRYDLAYRLGIFYVSIPLLVLRLVSWVISLAENPASHWRELLSLSSLSFSL